MAKKNTKSRRADPGIVLLERRRQGRVIREARQMPDASGGIGRPFRAVDTLEAMEAAGSITAAMRDAGERFRDDFALARLDALRAADLERAGMGGMTHSPYGDLPPSLASEHARRRVWDQIRAVGGIGSPGGACLWGVLGWGQSLNEWAMSGGWSGRRVTPAEASGYFKSALGVLASQKNA